MSKTKSKTNSKMWLKIAKIIAEEKTTCKSGRKVGCVIVSKNGRILSSGYNGVPSKMPHPKTCARRDAGVTTGECLHLCICQHAESNAIVNAARNGIKIEGSKMFCTTSPCFDCFGKIINAGIIAVHYENKYKDITNVENMSKIANVSVKQVK